MPSYKKGDEPVKKSKAVKPVAEKKVTSTSTADVASAGEARLLSLLRKGKAYKTQEIFLLQGMDGLSAGWKRPNIVLASMLAKMVKKGLITKKAIATWVKI